MMYKVFLIEDEFITGETIHDRVDWSEARYEFCGEAPDCQSALPLLRERKPDLAIADLKVLAVGDIEFCHILREMLPEIRIIILSGQDEIRQAQRAIQLGVTEYLLKPIAPQDLLGALHRVANQLDRERAAIANLQALQAQMADQRALLRERFLFELVNGSNAAEIIGQCRGLDIDLFAAWYLVLVIRAMPDAVLIQLAYDTLQCVDATITDTIAGMPEVIRFKKDAEETVLILRGGDADHLQREGRRIVALLRQQIQQRSACPIAIGIGQPTEQIGTIAQSFAHAHAHAIESQVPLALEASASQRPDLLKPDTSVVMRLLRGGAKTDRDQFFAAYLEPFSTADRRSRALIDYVVTDAILSAAAFLRELGATPTDILPELGRLELLLAQIPDLEHVKEPIWRVLQKALEYRDRQAHHQSALVARARAYIDVHYAEPNISLGSVAAQVRLSPSYFSVVFGREVGETFIEYLTNVRISKAMELLRTTALTSSEIAYQVGYHNPRYFYSVFRKVVGQSPIEFRRQV